MSDVGVNYEHEDADSKFFFGVFFNQARLNAYIALCHISEMLEFKTVGEDSLYEMPVLTLLKDIKDIAKSERAFRLFDKYFPMLKTISAFYIKGKLNGEDKTDEMKNNNLATVPSAPTAIHSCMSLRP